MYLKRKKQTSSHLIKKNMILKLIWNQTKCQSLNHCTTCYKKNYKYYMNILTNSLQKNLFDQVISHLSHLCCLSRNQKRDYIFEYCIVNQFFAIIQVSIVCVFNVQTRNLSRSKYHWYMLWQIHQEIHVMYH